MTSADRCCMLEAHSRLQGPRPSGKNSGTMGVALQEMSKSTRSVGLPGPLGPPTSHSEVCPSPASRGSVGRSIRKPDCGRLNLAQVA